MKSLGIPARLYLLAQQLLTVLLICGLLPAHANAVLIVDVGGRNDTGALIGAGFDDEAAAMAFSIDEGLTDVTLSAPIACISCSGAIWLHRNRIGNTGSLGDLVTAERFDSSSSTAPLFSGLELDPGLYFLIASIETGFGVWSGSSLGAAAVTLASGATAGPYFTSDTGTGFAPLNDFDVVLDGLLHLSVAGARLAEVPEPGSLLLFGMAFLALLRRRKLSG